MAKQEDRKEKKGKKSGPLTLALWVIFISAVAAVTYFSFQNGERSSLVGKGVIDTFAASYYDGAQVTSQQLAHLTYLFRQGARGMAFFFIGILGTWAVHITLKRFSWFLRSVISVLLLGAVACLTEKLKIYIPSRHYSGEEMLISLFAVLAGFGLTSLVMLLAGIIRFVFFRKPAASKS